MVAFKQTKGLNSGLFITCLIIWPLLLHPPWDLKVSIFPVMKSHQLFLWAQSFHNWQNNSPNYLNKIWAKLNNVSLKKSFPVRSLGWVEMAEQDLCEGRSSVAVHHCIRQLSYCRRDIRDSAGVWGEVSMSAKTDSYIQYSVCILEWGGSRLFWLVSETQHLVTVCMFMKFNQRLIFLFSC